MSAYKATWLRPVYAVPFSLRVGGILVSILLMWYYAYRITEYRNPVRQIGAVWVHLDCCRSQWTKRASDTGMAIFHLSYAIRHNYIITSSDEPEVSFPANWDELIQHTGGYAGSHMRGTLITAYPFLTQPLDPWDRPWVFRLDAYHHPGVGDIPDSVDIRLTYGSLGPDGKECEVIPGESDRQRRKCCDDSILTAKYYQEPPERLPPDVVIKPPLPPEVFTVPKSLW